MLLRRLWIRLHIANRKNEAHNPRDKRKTSLLFLFVNFFYCCFFAVCRGDVLPPFLTKRIKGVCHRSQKPRLQEKKKRERYLSLGVLLSRSGFFILCSSFSTTIDSELRGFGVAVCVAVSATASCFSSCSISCCCSCWW
jgi:hypothetical protein